MATLTFNGESFTVDHAVKGADYVHGYDANGNLVISLDGVKNFSGITYSGTYMSPNDCLAEVCNDVKFCGGSLKKSDGTILNAADFGAAPAGYGIGKLTNYSVASDTEVDNILKNQINSMGDHTFKRFVLSFTTVNNFTGGGGHYYTDIYKLSENFALITIKSYIVHGRELRRVWLSGKHEPWEWVNPPMILGVEYRTTERWNDRPVYTKLFSWTSTSDMSGSGRFEVPHGISNLDSASLRVEWTTAEWKLPHINTSEALYISGVDTAENSTKLVIKTTGNANWGSGRTFYFFMKYCKS